MARYTGPKCRLCRREGVKLYLKGERCESVKCPITRQRSVPGQHGGKRPRRLSDYARQLREKQKAKRLYGVLERQFKNYVEDAKAAKGESGTLLLQKLELRLDNIVYRLGLCQSRAQGRQLVRQGKFSVNGKKVSVPSLGLATGDKIGFTGKPLGTRKNLILPEWLSFDKKSNIGTVKNVPQREQIEQEINEALIIEYYSR